MALFQGGGRVALREGVLVGQRQREALKLPYSNRWGEIGQHGTRPCGVFSQGQDIGFCFENCGHCGMVSLNPVEAFCLQNV